MISPADKIAVVIPAYNESKAIGNVIAGLKKEFPWLEIVVVDDGSADGTWQVLLKLDVHALRHPVNLGQGGALQTGIDYAGSLSVDYIVMFDADGQHRVEDIPKFIEVLRDGDADIVLGSRFLDPEAMAKIPPSRRRLLRLATLFTRVTTGLALTDTHNGFRAFRPASIPALEMHINGMAHATEILENIARNKLCWREVPVTIDYTEYSRAKGQRAGNLFNILWDLIGR